MDKARNVPGRFVFIGGVHRSGTTLVENFVHAHFDVSVLRGPVPENEGQHLQSVYPAAIKHGGPGKFAFAPEMTPEPPTQDEAATLRADILDQWRPYVVGKSALLVEKSPPNLTKLNWLRAVFPGARFLIVSRDPRAVAAATQKWAKTSLEELMMHWNVAYSAALRSWGDDCHKIRYEDFCADPLGALDEAGVAALLPRRETPLPMESRFETLEDRNMEYIARHRCRTYGRGAWTEFGYEA